MQGTNSIVYSTNEITQKFYVKRKFLLYMNYFYSQNMDWLLIIYNFHVQGETPDFIAALN